MRIRVPVGVRNRLLRLEGNRSVNLPIGGWPPIMGVDEWEKLASMSQDALVAAAQGNSTSSPEALNTAVAANPTPIPRQSRPGEILSYLPGLRP